MRVEITPVDGGIGGIAPGRKLADVALLFEPTDPAALAGVRFEGFAVYRGHRDDHQYRRGTDTAPPLPVRVVMPVRTYTRPTGRYTYVLARPTTPDGLTPLINLIRAAWHAYTTTGDRHI